MNSYECLTNTLSRFNTSDTNLSLLHEEAVPVIFSLFPQQLDQISLRAIWWQRKQRKQMPIQPPVAHNLLDMVMDRSIVHYHNGMLVLAGGLSQLLQELNNLYPLG